MIEGIFIANFLLLGIRYQSVNASPYDPLAIPLTGW
jgi:hypothetical protein